jgi:acetate kinase
MTLQLFAKIVIIVADILPMSRRCGNLDPGVVLYLMQEKGMTAAEVSDLLYNDSGLFGVSGLSGLGDSDQ